MLKELINFKQIKSFTLEEVANIFYRCYFEAVTQHTKYDENENLIRTLKFKKDYFKNRYYKRYYFVETITSLVILENNILEEKLFVVVAFTKEEYRRKGYMQNILLEIGKNSKKDIFVDTDSVFLIHIFQKINTKCSLRFKFFRKEIKDVTFSLHSLILKGFVSKKEFKEYENYRDWET